MEYDSIIHEFFFRNALFLTNLAGNNGSTSPLIKSWQFLKTKPKRIASGDEGVLLIQARQILDGFY
jgi:hypothetical protein